MRSTSLFHRPSPPCRVTTNRISRLPSVIIRPVRYRIIPDARQDARVRGIMRPRVSVMIIMLCSGSCPKHRKHYCEPRGSEHASRRNTSISLLHCEQHLSRENIRHTDIAVALNACSIVSGVTWYGISGNESLEFIVVKYGWRIVLPILIMHLVECSEHVKTWSFTIRCVWVSRWKARYNRRPSRVFPTAKRNSDRRQASLGNFSTV